MLKKIQQNWGTTGLLCLCWGFLVLVLLVWTNQAEDEHTRDMVKIQAKTLFYQIRDTRAWNSAHRGIFVPESSWSPQNEYLPESQRALTLDNNMTLVKVNPAYMTRQLAEFCNQSTVFRISSLNPVRGENLSDSWEKAVLQRFPQQVKLESFQKVFTASESERAFVAPAHSSSHISKPTASKTHLDAGYIPEGWTPFDEAGNHLEFFELTHNGNQAVFRYMAPLYTYRDCVSCHVDEQIGNLRGGISISIAADEIFATAAQRKNTNVMTFAFLGLVGIGGIGGATMELNRRKLQAEQANRAKSAFLVHFSHDMRTPLTGIIGMLGQMEKSHPEQGESYAHMRDSAAALLTTVQDIMDHSVNEKLDKTWSTQLFSLSASLNCCLDAVRPACMGKGLELHSQIAPEIPVVLLGDSYRVRQVVGNLLGNAVKFTESGMVSLFAEGQINTRNATCDLQIVVSDTGPGILPEEQPRIFDLYERGTSSRRADGFGMGLAIAKSLAKGMGGDITMKSSPAGTTFTFSVSLPLVDSLATQSQPGMNEPGSFLENTLKAPLFLSTEALQNFDNDIAFMHEVCSVFLEDLHEKNRTIIQEMEQDNQEEVLRAVHALKNSAATLKCERLRLIGTSLELALRKKDEFLANDNIQTLLASWHTVSAETEEALASFLKQKKG